MFGMEVRLVVKTSAESNPYTNQSSTNKTTGIGGKARVKRFVKGLKKESGNHFKRVRDLGGVNRDVSSGCPG